MNPEATVQSPAEEAVRVSRAKVTLAMILCGIVSAMAVGAASAAAPDDDAPSVVVKYQPVSLETAAGAHAVYRRIVLAAEQVCPANVDSRLLNEAVEQCRAQSIARAVMKINNPRLAAVHDGALRSG